ncbi:MAG TPA: MucR family transcriptional regulator [Allosphingosinicella sp.]|nr:MucR family transcriptional regulator [Allosphingosinicella sp.]
MPITVDRETLLTLTADIVSAHIANNRVSPGDVAGLIVTVHEAMSSLGPVAEDPQPPALRGMVSPRASIKPDYLISLIDGRRYKMLRGHLRRHGYTPESYRQAYGLPYDYPMVSPNYSELRRAVAHKIGLGRRPKA